MAEEKIAGMVSKAEHSGLMVCAELEEVLEKMKRIKPVRETYDAIMAAVAGANSAVGRH